MTYSKIFGFGLIVTVLLAAVKIFLYQSFDWQGSSGIHYFFWLLCACIPIALVRRLGVISYLEVFLVTGIWIFLILMADLGVAAGLLGYRIFLNIPFLIGYIFVIVGMFIFHKKRHIVRRREIKQSAPPAPHGH